MEDEIRRQVSRTYGDRVRVRACGVLTEGEALLLINHRGVGSGANFWSPPGGGVHFGEPVPDALHREFREETGLAIDVNELLFVNEFIGKPLHAIELFFAVRITGGTLRLGHEPEMNRPIIQEVRFVPWADIRQLPDAQKHNAFHDCRNLTDFTGKRGYFQWVKPA